MRLGLLGILAFLPFVALGAIASSLLPGAAFYLAPYSVVLFFLALGGLIALLAVVAREQLLPGFVHDVVRSVDSGFLMFLIGADGKVRLLPGVSDGHFITPGVKPYKDRYVFAADGQSVMPVHRGKGVRAVLAFMKYPFTLDGVNTAAIRVFRRRGYKTVEDLWGAVKAWEELERLGGREKAESLLDELRAEYRRVADDEGMDEEEKGRMLEELGREIKRLEAMLEKAPMSREELEADLGGVTIRAEDLLDYLLWRHHPSDLKKIIHAEQAALMEKVKETWLRDWWRKWLPIIVIVGLVIMGILAVMYIGQHPASSGAMPTLIPRNITGG